MTIELRLVRDGKTIFSIPIDSSGEGADKGKLELEEDDMERLADLYSVAANERRFRIMHELTRRGEMKHADILRIAMNPKVDDDCINPMVEGGIVMHEGKGAGERDADT